MKKYYTYKTKMVTKADCKAYCDINGCDMFDSFLQKNIKTKKPHNRVGNPKKLWVFCF